MVGLTMGLGIYLHTGARRCTVEQSLFIMEAEPNERAQAASDLGLVYIHRGDFPQRCADLEAAAYSVAETRCIWSGSYSGWSGFRERLAETAGLHLGGERADGRSRLTNWWELCAAAEDRGTDPLTRFWQLLHFSDCDGTLGPAVCSELAEDFRLLRVMEMARWEFFHKRANHKPPTDWHRTWRESFKSAGSSNGFVTFD